jgi:2-phosphoglycolate phosphatase
VKHPGADLKAVLFDLDGTLVDTADDFIPAVQQLRAENGLPPMDPASIRKSVSNGSRALVNVALSLLADEPGFEENRLRLLELYAALLGRHARLYPGLGALVETLEQRGIGWGIATNKPSAYTWPLLEALKLSPAPGTVICPDDVSHPKPHPESLHRICATLDCSSAQAIYVGDHSRDIEAGRNAGMFTIAAAYGYIEDGDAAERWGADSVAAHSTLLKGMLLDHSKDTQ